MCGTFINVALAGLTMVLRKYANTMLVHSSHTCVNSDYVRLYTHIKGLWYPSTCAI